MDSNSTFISITDRNVLMPTNIEIRHELTFDDGEDIDISIECHFEYEQTPDQNQVVATNIESQLEIDANPVVQSNESEAEITTGSQPKPKTRKNRSAWDTWEEFVASWSNVMPPNCPWQDTEKCPICLEAYTETSHPAQVNPCQHIFHYECIEEWMKEWERVGGEEARIKFGCPTCRTEIKDFKSDFTDDGDCYTQTNVGRVHPDVPNIKDTLLIPYPPGGIGETLEDIEQVISHWLDWLATKTHMRAIILRGLRDDVGDLEIESPWYDAEVAIRVGTRLPHTPTA